MTCLQPDGLTKLESSPVHSMLMTLEKLVARERLHVHRSLSHFLHRLFKKGEARLEMCQDNALTRTMVVVLCGNLHRILSVSLDSLLVCRYSFLEKLEPCSLARPRID